MLSGPASRTRAAQKKYAATFKTTKSCDFCAFTINHEQIIEEFAHFWLAKNIFGYNVWDGLGVTEHLMIVPKRHIDSLGGFKPNELKEYSQLLARFEGTGYSIYSRSTENTSKSVTHQHTHLIKLDNKRKKIQLHVRKPHIMISF